MGGGVLCGEEARIDVNTGEACIFFPLYLIHMQVGVAFVYLCVALSAQIASLWSPCSVSVAFFFGFFSLSY